MEELGLDLEGYEASRTMRSALKKIGWELIIGEDKVLSIRPDESGSIDYAKDFMSEADFSESQEEIDEIEEALDLTFGLEKDMQSAIRKDISQLENGLEIADGGKERSVYSGRIDILARDKKGNHVVIELKAGYASPKAITQVLAYMGDIKEETNTEVRGILIADEFDKKVTSAAKVISNVALKKYSFQFKFEDI